MKFCDILKSRNIDPALNNIRTLYTNRTSRCESLAKDVFQLHGVDAMGNKVLSKRLSRNRLAKFIANLKLCLIGMEACGGAHYWARKFRSFGHDVKLMAPQFVKPYVKTNKNDPADAELFTEPYTRARQIKVNLLLLYIAPPVTITTYL